jgi:hypothetical protein
MMRARPDHKKINVWRRDRAGRDLIGRSNEGPFALHWGPGATKIPRGSRPIFPDRALRRHRSSVDDAWRRLHVVEPAHRRLAMGEPEALLGLDLEQVPATRDDVEDPRNLEIHHTVSHPYRVSGRIGSHPAGPDSRSAAGAQASARQLVADTGHVRPISTQRCPP